MKKGIIITVVIVLALAGGAVTKLVMDKSNDKKEESMLEASPSVQPQENQQTEVPSQTNEPTATEEVTETPEVTEETPAVENTLPEADVLKLTDDELVTYVVAEIQKRHATVQKMTDKERVVYSVDCFNRRMQKGLQDYLTSKDNVTAMYLTDAFESVKATNLSMLFEDFTHSYHIDLSKPNQLSQMKKDDYNFGIFDQEYKGLAKDENLTTLLASYIRANIKDLK